MKNNDLKQFIKNIPKAELHLHIEGTLEPELMFKIAKRNNIVPKYKTVEDLKNAYMFSNLQEFLDIYYEGAGVLAYQQDFFDMIWEYYKVTNKICTIEVFFDKLTSRGLFQMLLLEFIRKKRGEKLGISFRLVCVFADLDEASAFDTLQITLKNDSAVGLDSPERTLQNLNVFLKAIKEGF